MLKAVQIGNALPIQYPVNPTSVFEAGMIAELTTIGNDIVCGVSSGLAPINSCGIMK